MKIVWRYMLSGGQYFGRTCVMFHIRQERKTGKMLIDQLLRHMPVREPIGQPAQFSGQQGRHGAACARPSNMAAHRHAMQAHSAPGARHYGRCFARWLHADDELSWRCFGPSRCAAAALQPALTPLTGTCGLCNCRTMCSCTCLPTAGTVPD